MKNSGFTLIELLAVIVILAIIALIATPIVINIINDTKESSEEESLKLYEDAVNKMIVKRQMTDATFNPSECKIQNDGNLKCTVGTKIVDVEVEVKGTKPTSGTVAIEENKVELKNVKFNGKDYYERGKLISDSDGDGEISIGDKYSYKVNDNDKYIFYVLSIDNNKVNLIMDRNICTDGTPATESNKCLIAWYAAGNDNTNGPVTAMQGVYNATKNWNNVPDMNFSYSDESSIYGEIVTESNGIKLTKKNGIEVTREENQTPVILYESAKMLKARLPKQKELADVNCKFSSYPGTCPNWLVENLSSSSYSVYSDNVNIPGINGYWILSTNPDETNSARYIHFDGHIHSNQPNNSSNYGVRPVITVSKSDLSE